MAPTGADDLRDRELRHALRRGKADDEQFDALFPDAIRAASGVFWTPLRVAQRAAELLSEHGARRVLDVGAGPGKFCLVGAIAEPGLSFTGVEHRPHLVHVALAAARRLRIDNATFVAGDVSRFSRDALDAFDGLYFFNPFAENRFDVEERFDDEVELDPARLAADVAASERALARSREGTVVVTYHGYGGRIPRAYRLSRSERCGTDWLNVWVKESEEAGFWFEYEDEDTGAPIFLATPIAIAEVAREEAG